MYQRAKTDRASVRFWSSIAFMLITVICVYRIHARDRTFGDPDITSVEIHAGEAATEWNESSVRRAIELYLNAADLLTAKGNFSQAAEDRRSAVRLKLILNEGKSALETLDQVARSQSKTLLPLDQARNLDLYSEVWLHLNNYDKSEYFQKKALKAAIETKQNGLIARTYLTEAAIQLNRQNFSAMETPLQKSLEIFRRLGDRDGESEVLTEMAYCATLNNDRLRARELADESLSVARKNGLQRRRVFALIALGDANQRIGDWQAAMAAFLEAKRDFPQNVDLYENAILTNRIGFYYLTYGNLDKANELFIESNLLFDEIGRASACSELQSILGEISSIQGNFDQAIAYFRKSSQYSKKSGTVIASGTLNQKVGEAQFGLGHLAEAEKSLNFALRSYDKLGVNFRSAEVRQTLGMISESRGEIDTARYIFDQALQYNQSVHNIVAQAQDYHNLARLDYKQGKIDDSLYKIEKSIDFTESTRNETANSFLRNTFSSNVYDRYDLFIELLMQRFLRSREQTFFLRALQVSEREHSREMLRNLSLADSDFYSDAPRDLLDREKGIRELLNTEANKLTETLSKAGQGDYTKKLEASIREFENQIEEIRAELKQNSPIYSAIKSPEPFDVADFQANTLDDNSVLLEFSLGKEESYLWVVSKTEVSSFVLPARERIEGRVERLRTILKARATLAGESLEDYQARMAAAENEYAVEARGLSDDILGQAADKIAGKRLIVVADGKLQYFPLGSLPMPNSESGDPILLTNEVVYEPSASALKIFKSDSKVGVKPTKDVLVFADPVFSKDDDRLTGLHTTGVLSTFLGGLRSAESITNLPRLPESEEEAKAIASIIGSDQTTVRSGFSANRDSALNSDIADYKVLHIASHGLIDETRPELSGIVLSMFNQDGSPQDGGFIRLQDVYGLNLHTDLVVLSACNTGIGKEVKGEGVMSLNNAFLQSGAKSVVSSLWKVDDSATRELMTNFYSGMATDGLTASAALRKAQIAMYNTPQFRSPFYWAAFTLQGDYQRAPQISRGPRVWIYVGGFLTLLVIFVLYRRRRIQIHKAH